MAIPPVYLLLNNQSVGPFTEDQLREMADAGRITPNTICTVDYGKSWVPISASGFWMQLLSSGTRGPIKMPGLSLQPQPVPVQPTPVPQPTPVQPTPVPQPAQPWPTPVPQAVPVQPTPVPQPAQPWPTPVPQPVPVQPAQPWPTPVPQAVPVQPTPVPQAVPVQPTPVPQAVPVQPTPVPQAVPVQPSPTQNSDRWTDELETPDSERHVEEIHFELSDGDENDPTPEMTCPHCWYVFHQSKILYIAQHPELVGDPALGPTAQMRFLPTAFTSDGVPLDPMGLPCTDMACPKCHLQIPDVMLDHQNDLLSIVGCPSAGKSYYLTALISQMRKSLMNFNYSVTDADTTLNLVVSNYEQVLFQNGNRGKVVALPKTELQGSDFSSQVLLDGFTVNLPLPFVYTIRAMEEHAGTITERNLVFYDNAGEHFEPGRDQVANRATQHLVKSQCVIFLLDPFKDVRLRSTCVQNDPQAGKWCRDVNQMQILNEMIGRMRKNSGLTRNQKYSRPLMLVVSKFDALVDQFPLDVREVDYLINNNGVTQLNIAYVKLVSYLVRNWLISKIPELVPTCEAFFERVYYLPASALGTSPVVDEATGMLGITPESVKPTWCDAPLLIRMWENGLIPGCTVQVDASSRGVDEYCTVNGSIMSFLAPGMSRSIIIPRLYWGAEVHDERLGFIRFPNPQIADSKETASAGAGEDDFWK